MKINWKLRLQNKYTVAAMLTCVISFIYSILDTIGVVPAVDQSSIEGLVETVVLVLTALGILVDPTTSGASDSELAMNRQHIKE